MGYRDITPDFGGPGNGARFIRLFEERIREKCPNRAPSQVWDNIYRGLAIKPENANATPAELGKKVMDLFQDGMRPA
jgi:hypothetical protein